jgi:hypothetical protein
MAEDSQHPLQLAEEEEEKTPITIDYAKIA